MRGLIRRLGVRVGANRAAGEATWAWLDIPRRADTRIVNEVIKGIDRVTYDITSKTLGTNEWE